MDRRGGGVTRRPRFCAAMKLLFASLLAVATLSAAQSKQTFVGVITDSECGKAGHSRMQMGPSDADCVLACIDMHGATYILFDGKEIYALSDQKTPQEFPDQTVRVVGTLDVKSKMILVDSIAAAK